MIDKDTVIRTADHVKTAHFDGEAIVLDTSSGQYFGVNTLGGRVLTLLEDPISIRQILDRLSDEYDVDRNRLEEDVSSFVGELDSKGLINS